MKISNEKKKVQTDNTKIQAIRIAANIVLFESSDKWELYKAAQKNDTNSF